MSRSTCLGNMWHCGPREAAGVTDTHIRTPGQGKERCIWGEGKKKKETTFEPLYQKLYMLERFFLCVGVFYVLNSTMEDNLARVCIKRASSRSCPCYLECLHRCGQAQTSQGHTQSRSDSACTAQLGSWTHRSPCQPSGSATAFT